MQLSLSLNHPWWTIRTWFKWSIKLAKPDRSGKKLSSVEENDGKGSGGPKLPQQGEEHLVRFKKLGIFQIMAFLCFKSWSRIKIWNGSNTTKKHERTSLKDGFTWSPAKTGPWQPWSRLQQMQASPETTWQQETTVNFLQIIQISFAVYLTKREDWLTTPTVDHKYAEDAARNLDEDAGKQNKDSWGCWKQKVDV